MKKFALIHLGNDESYGLVFVAGELKKNKQKIRWFDGESEDVVNQIVKWKPDFVCFSPLTTFFDKALNLSKQIKKSIKVKSVFGGQHVFASKELVDGIDIIVTGSICGIINRIIDSNKREIISNSHMDVDDMVSDREDYFKAIPRVANRHRKYIMSCFGCIYNCSYCSTSNARRYYGKDYNNCFLKRRSVKSMIEEAKIFLRYKTEEVSFEDDDIFAGQNAEKWLKEFAKAWKEEIKLPLYANVTPLTIVRASDELMHILAILVKSVQMGVQVVTPDSLKLFNRIAQNKEIIKLAYKRLTDYGIPVKMEFIMGLPIKDPISDAIESIKFAQEIDAKFISAFPLMLYPATDLEKYCKNNDTKLNNNCKMEWHTGIGSIKFDDLTNKRLKNIVKLAPFFVKFKVNERWIRALIDMDMTEKASEELSKCQYLDSLIFRGVKNAEENFDNIIKGMEFKW